MASLRFFRPQPLPSMCVEIACALRGSPCRELSHRAEVVPVGPQVFDLLLHLVRNRDRVVSKDDLLTAVWSGRIVPESTITSHINAVRKAIGDTGEERRLVRTVARKGFRFVGEVKVGENGGVEHTSSESTERPDKPSVAVLPFQLERAEIERAKRKPTESLDAYDYYLRGTAKLHSGTCESIEAALPLLYKATELDPDFASAYGMAAWCHFWRKVNGWMTDRPREIAEGTRLARRAVELGRDDAVALTRGGHALGRPALPAAHGRRSSGSRDGRRDGHRFRGLRTHRLLRHCKLLEHGERRRVGRTPRGRHQARWTWLASGSASSKPTWSGCFERCSGPMTSFGPSPSAPKPSSSASWVPTLPLPAGPCNASMRSWRWTRPCCVRFSPKRTGQ